MESLIRNLLVALGEDPEREGLLKTPKRVATAFQELTAGYREDPVAMMRGAIFQSESKGMVVCRDIEFVSLCEHHILPFVGKALVAYLPSDRLVGISKLVKVVEAYARRLQVQERMGQQIVDAIEESLHPEGILVHLEATHLCMVARGVKQRNAVMETTHVSGRFQADPTLVTSVLRSRS